MATTRRPLIAGNWKMNGRTASLSELDKIIAAAPGVTARVFPGVNAMLSVVTLEPHSVSPVHSHANEQWGVCLEGEWIRIQDGVEHPVKAGDFCQTPPNVLPK